MDERVWERTVFCANRDRLLEDPAFIAVCGRRSYTAVRAPEADVVKRKVLQLPA